MKSQYTFAALMLAFVSSTTIYAAGGAVNEDLVPLKELTQDMISMCKKANTEGFMKQAGESLKMTAENKNNSNVLPRVSAKLRVAKSAVKKGQFNEAIIALQEAGHIMETKKPLTWDGGSE
jgi:hypothetical protein